jgi:hypothetical protein
MAWWFYEGIYEAVFCMLFALLHLSCCAPARKMCVYLWQLYFIWSWLGWVFIPVFGMGHYGVFGRKGSPDKRVYKDVLTVLYMIGGAVNFRATPHYANMVKDGETGGQQAGGEARGESDLTPDQEREEAARVRRERQVWMEKRHAVNLGLAASGARPPGIASEEEGRVILAEERERAIRAGEELPEHRMWRQQKEQGQGQGQGQERLDTQGVGARSVSTLGFPPPIRDNSTFQFSAAGSASGPPYPGLPSPLYSEPPPLYSDLPPLYTELDAHPPFLESST